MSLIPYLHFQGTCEEALHFYAEVFEAPPPTMVRYRDAPADAGLPSSDRVMNAALTLGDGRLMASDFPDGMEGDPQKAVSIMYPVPDAEAGRRLYDRLLEGGDVIMPFEATFWSEGFGMVRDRFGTHWIIAGPERGA